MNTVEIKPQIFWVGAKDWNLREFHGYKTQKGTTYNSYLIIDEKITLVDTVKSAHFEQMLSRIKTIIDPSRIDYIICNHAEMDHAGAILKISELAPNAEIIASPHGEKYLNSYFLVQP
ncbi:MAG: MBL fold metallo-hydrolase [Nitrospinota bacterium]